MFIALFSFSGGTPPLFLSALSLWFLLEVIRILIALIIDSFSPISKKNEKNVAMRH